MTTAEDVFRRYGWDESKVNDTGFLKTCIVKLYEWKCEAEDRKRSLEREHGYDDDRLYKD
jgi:hypothetical protein